MRIPPYQRSIAVIVLILAGALGFGELLAARTHALELSGPERLWGAAIILCGYSAFELFVRFKRPVWVWGEKSWSRILRPGPEIRCLFAGIVLILWYPKVAHAIFGAEFDREVPATRGDVEDAKEAIIKALQLGSAERLPPEIAGLRNLSGSHFFRLGVARGENVDWSVRQIDRVLTIASVFLGRCGVRVERQGEVKLSTLRAILIAQDLPKDGPDLHVVAGINMCPSAGDGTDLPGRFLVCKASSRLILSGSQAEGIAGLALAHGLGDLAGLPHSASPLSLMSPLLDKDMAAIRVFPEITDEECVKISDAADGFLAHRGN